MEIFANGIDFFANGMEIFVNGIDFFANGMEIFEKGMEFLLIGGSTFGSTLVAPFRGVRAPASVSFSVC